VDVSTNSDLILVTNGVYQTGGRVAEGSLTNRVAVDKPVTVQSVNGPSVTVIGGFTVSGTLFGSNAVRCVYMTNGATLAGFTLTNGAALNYASREDISGGGVYCQSTSATLSNCVLAGNFSHEGGGACLGTLIGCALIGNSVLGPGSSHPAGGGAAGSILEECAVVSNSASAGGGVWGCKLINCTIVSNTASIGGGVFDGGFNETLLINCTIVGNTATNEGGGAFDGILKNCIIYGNYCPSANSYTSNVL